MKFKIIIFFLLMHLSNIAFSQESSEKAHLLSLSLGPAIPISDLVNDYALTGFDIGVNYIYRPSHNFGWVVQLRRIANPVDEDGVIEEYAHSDPQASITSGSYNRFGLLTGPQLLLPLSPTFCLHLGGYAGMVQAVYPEINMTGPGNYYYLKIKKTTALTFACGGQMLLRKEINNKIFMTAGLDYFFSEPSFKEWTRDVNNTDGDVYHQVTDVKMKYNSLSVLIGVGLKFNKQ